MFRLARSVAPCVLALVAAASPSAAQVDARLLRFPDVSATQIAFVFGGDVWVVPKTGGVAQRLSSPRGEETFPRFSPDGSRIAFTGNYDGNEDVYVIPVGGGLPVRVTHHPAPDRTIDWYPDGRSILMASSMTSEKDRFNKLFRVGAGGGLPEQLPMPYGEFGSLSPDGKKIAYTTGAIDFRTWKRYRGGLAQDIWVFDLEQKTARKIAENEANDIQPMWHGQTIYFVSDRGPGHRNNIWAYDLASGRARQITHFTTDDVHFPAAGPSDIVFQNGGQLYLLDLKSQQARPVDVKVVSDLASVRPRPVNVSRLIQSFDVSPTGKRAAFEARGELFTVPEKNGVVRNVTTTSASAERTPAWSPDGKWIAYWSDRTGEYELTVESADAAGQPRTVTKLGPGFRYRPFWSPDSKRVAFIDQDGRMHVTDVATGRTTDVDQTRFGAHGYLANWTPSWSADGRWLAYNKVDDKRASVVMLYDTRSGKATQVTSGFYQAQNPAFDPAGKYLYFLTNRDFAPTYSAIDNTWIYANATVIAAVPLRRDVPSPIAPRNDEEKGPPQTPAQAEARMEARRDSVRRDSARVVPAAQAVEIDLADFERRLVVLPLKAGNYGELQAVQGKVLYHKHSRAGDPQGVKQAIAYYDLEEREEKIVLEDAITFIVTADGKRMLVRLPGAPPQPPQFAILDIKPAQKVEKPLATADLEATVDPRPEWRQIFADAWRFNRDYFYDPNMHGVDWSGMRRHYGALLEQASTREDVNWILGELIGELNSSHTYRGGGDLEQPQRRGVGLLGVDFALDNGAFRIRRIVDGAIWDSEVRSPLARPGVNVREGDYVLAVNGRRLDPAKDPWEAFQGLAGQSVELLVNSRPAVDGARSVLVETLRDELRLRNLAWIDAKRRRVYEATNGRIGYVYVPSTGIDGQTELARQFYGQASMDGLIIDERFNNGGQIPDRFVELLNRPVLNYWAVRSGQDWQWPQVANPGPKVMLINEWSGSGGDAFPLYFKQAGLGPLIGTRTWGGLIGISGVPPLVDGGGVTVPTFAIYSNDGQWIVENEGVKPDIVVVDDPGEMARGRDPQLERAIQEAMRLLAQNPPKRPKRPPYVNRTSPVAANGAKTGQ